MCKLFQKEEIPYGRIKEVVKCSDFIEMKASGHHLGQIVEADIPSDAYRPHFLPQQPPNMEQEERHPFCNANSRSNQEKQLAHLG